MPGPGGHGGPGGMGGHGGGRGPGGHMGGPMRGPGGHGPRPGGHGPRPGGHFGGPRPGGFHRPGGFGHYGGGWDPHRPYRHGGCLSGCLTFVLGAGGIIALIVMAIGMIF